MKKEITVLIGVLGTDGRQLKKHVWKGEIAVLAWKDTELHKESTCLWWATTYDKLMEMSQVLTAFSIVKLLVRERGTEFELLEVLEKSVDDYELDIIKKELKKPVYYQDQLLGKFKLNKQSDLFIKNLLWDTDKGKAHVHNTTPEQLEKSFKRLNQLHEPIYLQQIKGFAANEMASLTEEWSGKSLSANELIAYLKFKELVIDSNGDFTVYLGARQIFGDHDIQVEGNTLHGLTTVYL